MYENLSLTAIVMNTCQTHVVFEVLVVLTRGNHYLMTKIVVI